MKCVKCGRSTKKPSTGRPPRYCGEGCRRSSEYEIRRLVRRLEALEDDLVSLRGVRDDGIPDAYGHTPGKRRTLLREGIKDDEERLRVLLDTGQNEAGGSGGDETRGRKEPADRR